MQAEKHSGGCRFGTRRKADIVDRDEQNIGGLVETPPPTPRVGPRRVRGVFAVEIEKAIEADRGALCSDAKWVGDEHVATLVGAAWQRQ